MTLPETPVRVKPAEPLLKRVADEICAANHFAQDAGGKLYRYSAGAYRQHGENFIRRQVKALLQAWGEVGDWSTKFANEVVAFIGVDAPDLWPAPPLELVNVANGLLRLTDGKLLPHTPEHLSSVQLPVKFDPAATCPAIDQFIQEIFPSDATELAYELPAWLMAPDRSIQKAVLLLGAGGNGKSAYLAMVTAFLGTANCKGLTLQKLSSERFALAQLVGKLANICADLPSNHLESTYVFKALTGSDGHLNAENKFQSGFEFDPYCRLVFSANAPPRSSDNSDGFFDRWLIVPFDARFRGSKREIPRKALDARLQAPAELSGLLNRALQAWQEIQKRGGRLSEPQSVKAAFTEFRATTDPLAVFLDRYTLDDVNGFVPKSELETAYAAECERRGLPKISTTALTKALAHYRPNVEIKQRRINGQHVRCYIGLSMLHPAGLGRGCEHSETGQTSEP